MTNWTQGNKDEVAVLLKAGNTAQQIGDALHKPRNAIIGIVRRDKELSAIGFARKGVGGHRKATLSREEGLERRKQYDIAYKARKRGNVIPFPKPTRNLPASSPQRPAPVLRVVSNNVPLMVQDWLEKNGGARKFNDRDGTDFLTIKDFLEARGIAIKLTKNSWTSRLSLYNVSRGQGRPKAMKWAGVVEIVDGLRISEGLQPFGAHALPAFNRQRRASKASNGAEP